MRKKIRARVFVSIIGCAAVAAYIAACGGSDSTDVEAIPDAAPEVGPDTSKPDTSVADTSTADVVKETGPIYDAGPPNVLEAGPEYGEAGVACVAGGKLEEEPNDDKDAANVADPTRCGAILLTADGGVDAGVAESDFLTFTLKAATTSFFIQFSGDISMKVEVEGQPAVTVTPSTSPAIPFVKGKPYFIEIKSLNGQRANWRVTIFES